MDLVFGTARTHRRIMTYLPYTDDGRNTAKEWTSATVQPLLDVDKALLVGKRDPDVRILRFGRDS